MPFRPTLAVNADYTRIRYPVYASPKLDGIRCSLVNGRALSRTLKPIPNHFIRNTLEGLGELDLGLDGELIVGLPTSRTCYNESVSGVMCQAGEPNFMYHVFDMHNALGGFHDRLSRLKNEVSSLGLFRGRVQALHQVLLNHQADMLAYEAEQVALGYEGIILRAPDAPYKHGRSTVGEGYMLKVKRFEDSEAEIIGFEEEMFNGNEAQTNELGRTKRSTAAAGLSGKGSLGAFLVRDIKTNVEFAIGTGLTAAQRSDYWQSQNTLLGKLIKYKFFPIGVKVAPRHPVFLGLRDRADL